MTVKNASTLLTGAFASIVLSGCVVQQQPSYGPQGFEGAPMQQQRQVHMQQPQRQQQQQYVASPQVSFQPSPQVMSQINGLQERVRRVERAMIRLDRRMQLIERNELSRMSKHHMQGESTTAPSGMFQPMSYTPKQAVPVQQPQANNAYTPRTMPFQRNATFQPVSMGGNDGRITSSLQVAPQKVAYNKPASSNAFAGMPSLADKKDSGPKTDSVSVWTIRYEEEKVWPAREELKESHSVVQALRGDEPVALFARGARPASREFRERVRAVSKYLSKVSDLENVPIASMPAKYLDDDTIEILATK